jgi:uncharacterized protein YyaL (SSP411 family)
MINGYTKAYSVLKAPLSRNCIEKREFYSEKPANKDGSLYVTKMKSSNGFSEDYATVIEAYFIVSNFILDEKKWLNTAEEFD